MKELGASNMDGAAKPLNPFMPIRVQPAQMPTGDVHWMGEFLEQWRSVMAKFTKTLQDQSLNIWNEEVIKARSSVY